MSTNILIAGCGKIGFKLAEKLAADTLNRFKVWGLSRSQKSSKQDIDFISADLMAPDTLSNQLPTDLDFVVYCVTPSDRADDAYEKAYVQGQKNLLSQLSPTARPIIIFVSSTSVYHQNDSSWVNEESELNPKSKNAETLVNAEKVAKELGFHSCTVRFSGIYGNGRSMLIDQVKSGKTGLWPESRLTNRIHEQDCVGVLAHLIGYAVAGNTLASCYLASDCSPVEMNEVLEFIAEQYDAPLVQLSAPPKRRAGNKKCSNAKLLETGYQFQFPSYREGYLK